MKYKVNTPFHDKLEGIARQIGDEIEITKERAKEIIKGLGKDSLTLIKEEKKEDKPSKKSTKKNDKKVDETNE